MIGQEEKSGNDKQSPLQPKDVLGYSRQGCLFWVVTESVWSFPSNHRLMLRRLAHAACTVHANVIVWHPSSAALRNARRGGQKSSVAYVQYINTVCSWHGPIIFVVELSQSIRHISVDETASVMSRAAGVAVSCSCPSKNVLRGVFL